MKREKKDFYANLVSLNNLTLRRIYRQYQMLHEKSNKEKQKKKDLKVLEQFTLLQHNR